jgi:hypothetical protein
VSTKRSLARKRAKGKIGDDSGGRSGMNDDVRPHKYDNPRLSPREFLLAVMRDPTVALELRIEAAAKAMPLLETGDFPGLRGAAITYQIPELLLQ